ncbi:MAG: N-acetylmuramoyl-L-alanine amidase [Frankiales bacterium]|nr:N-acetylmuramoyl-L-alanine amidase [Frankiales bacterium]
MRLRSALLSVLVGAAGALAAMPPAGASVAPPTGHGDLRSFAGLGTWVDGYDFSRELTKSPTFTARTVQFAAANGVQTIYLQAAKRSPKTPYSLLSRDRLGAILLAAHARGIRVVGWYLPTFDSPSADFMHLDAMMQFKVDGQHFDGIGIDIENTDVPVAARNARLVALSQRVRARTWLPLTAIVLPPVLTEVIHPTYWGGSFPWSTLKPSYDVWVPMGYYTAYGRYPRWRDAAVSTAEDIRRLKAHLGTVPFAYAGGIADTSTPADYRGFTAAALAAGALGVSTYDYATTPGWAWPVLRSAAPQ